jgi:hypothetical protein
MDSSSHKKGYKQKFPLTRDLPLRKCIDARENAENVKKALASGVYQ